MSTIGAVILAAGMSKRMGQPKAVMPFLGKPLFRHCVDAAIAAGLQPIILVGGNRIEELLEHAAMYTDIEVIENKDYQSGMASSLKLGIKAVTGRADAAIVFLADQPFVCPDAIKKVWQSYDLLREAEIRIIRSEYGGTPGHPILFDADLFTEFSSIHGDEGGKSIIVKYHSRLHTIPFPNPEWGYDIDTPDDLLKLENIAKRFIE